MTGSAIFLLTAVLWHLVDKHLPDILAAYERRTVAIATGAA